MKKYLFRMCLIVFLSACSKNKHSEDTLVLCTNSTYPPYESIDKNGNSVGFDIDMASAIAKQLGKKLRILELPFDSMILTLEQGKCDFIMAGMSITPSRQKEILMIPYQGEPVKSYYLLFWKQNPVGMDALKGKTIAVHS